MKLSQLFLCFTVSSLLPLLSSAEGHVSGIMQQWHTVTLTFDGPETAESAQSNPFFDYRLNVVFSLNGRSVVVPGYYAADGKAGESGASTGGKWRVHFAPDEIGRWSYTASFRQGDEIAASLDAEVGTATSFDGATGHFTIEPSDKTGADFRSKGWLRYVGKHYPQFDNGDYFIRSGPGGPENFLGYADFDATSNGKHQYEPHVRDWKTGDPTWHGDQGKGIIGMINYIAAQGMSTMYFLTYNSAGGDGDDVWPWTGPTSYDRYDVSKLDQWEIVFSHMTAQGVELHLFLGEQENDLAMNDGNLGLERKVYYREMVARFGHHLAVTWNLGEEINTDELPDSTQIKSYCRFIRALDPYDHPIAVHSASDLVGLFEPLLGYPEFEMATIQTVDDDLSPMRGQILDWVSKSSAAGRPWIVTNDEQGGWNKGLESDADDPGHSDYRKQALWGTLLAGAGGISYYWYPDTKTDDLRPREQMWRLSTLAVGFFQGYLPFAEMTAADALTGKKDDYVFADKGRVYAVYLPDGGTTGLDLSGYRGNFVVDWWNPREGGALQKGSVSSVSGGTWVSLGEAPISPEEDWVVLVRADGPIDELDELEESGTLTGASDDGRNALDGDSSRIWVEKNGLVVMEAEKGTPETSDLWSIRDESDGYYGDGYIRWDGADYLNDVSHGVLTYRIRITHPGTYRLYLRSFHDPASRGKRIDEENDCWTSTSLNDATSYLKTFRNSSLAGTDWSYRTQWVLHDESHPNASYEITAGDHVLRIAARASYFMIDRVLLVKDSTEVESSLSDSPVTP